MRNNFIPFLLLFSLWAIFNPCGKAWAAEQVSAVVNGDKIYTSQVEKELSKYKDVDPSTLPDLKQDVLNELINHLLQEQFLKKQGIKVEGQVVEQMVENIRKDIKSNPNTSEFSLEDLLASYGSSLEELKNNIRISLGLKQYFTTNLDDKVLGQYFLQNKDVFTGVTVRASHILVDTKRLKSKEELKTAQEKIDKIKKDLDSGADFAETAKKYSNCPSSQRGGDLGYFPRKGALVEEFAETAFKLKVGEVSPPLKTEFGYHIIKVTDRKEGKDVTLEDVKEQVKENYLEDQSDKLVKKLRQEAKIQIKE